jgi:tripartite-type tricarboxylate transporter receptor subunit TctC
MSRLTAIRSLVPACLIAAALPLSVAQAQKGEVWPSRPIRLIVPFVPGGGTDLVARTVGAKLSEALGQTVLIDNRGGAGGNIGTEIATKAEPDGYTMLIGSIGAIAINPTLYGGKLPFDPVRDLAPITLSSDALNMLMVHPSVPATNVKELIEYVKKNPNKLSFSSSGLGATDHLAGELFNKMVGVSTIHVPYKGGGPAAADLAAGNVQFSFNTVSAQVGLWKGGKLRALAVTSAKRQPLFADLPAISETVPGYAVNNWYGFFVPTGTAKPTIDRLNTEINRILKMPDIIERHNAGGIVPLGTTPEEFAKFIRAESAKWAKVIKEAGLKAE